MRMLRTPPFFPPKSREKPYLEVFTADNKRQRLPLIIYIGVRAPLDLGGGGGGGDLIARKKLHNARKHVLYKRTQTAVKTKRSQFLVK